jgi:methanethiol S-methyltransferase
MGGAVTLLFGGISYIVFFLTFLYSIGFVGNIVVPQSIDSGVMTGSMTMAILINVGLLSLFAVQHSVMARPGFKKWWTTIVPESMERTWYVLLSSVVLIILYWQWQPMTAEVWTVDSAAGRAVLTGLFWIGWVVVLTSTFVIDHFDLFGLRQAWLRFRNVEYTPVEFVARLYYSYIRHPLLLGFLIAFWATPDMTQGHLLFAVMTTGYILVAVRLEETDLVTAHGEEYERYRDATPMLIPFLGGKKK